MLNWSTLNAYYTHTHINNWWNEIYNCKSRLNFYYFIHVWMYVCMHIWEINLLTNWWKQICSKWLTSALPLFILQRWLFTWENQQIKILSKNNMLMLSQHFVHRKMDLFNKRLSLTPKRNRGRFGIIYIQPIRMKRRVEYRRSLYMSVCPLIFPFVRASDLVRVVISLLKLPRVIFCTLKRLFL